uniref:Uncharacterized protein n=1 Tax=Avena sativa TaxID=4498 RepID=A0ACD5Y2S7_AVESA
MLLTGSLHKRPIRVKRSKQELASRSSPPPMATKQGPRRGHRRRHSKPTKASMSEPIPSGPTSVHHIPDHLLELVLVRVGSSLALLRAAFTCKRWRRIITDTSFLTRFRSLHGPHVGVLGHYHIVDPTHKKLSPDGNNQVFVPADGALLDRRHFSLDFLPDLDWELGDSRGGLLLLYRRNTIQRYRRRQAVLRFPDMIVCDPLTRRYQGILHWEEMYNITPCLGLFLLHGVDGCISMSNFRVVVALYAVSHGGRAAPYACVFSSGSVGGWQDSAPSSGGVVPIPELHLISFAGRARSSLYWRMEGEGAVLALNETTLEFSLVTFPSTVVGMLEESSIFRVIGSRSDAVRVVRIINNGDLTVFAQLQGSGEWVVENLVTLPEVATYGLPAKIVAANASYILVTPREENWIVSVDLHTLEVERAHERNRYAGAAHPYELQWPPALQACRAN